MKVLFYNHTGQVSGAERVLLMILARLDRRRFDPVVVCPTDGRLMQMIDDLGVRTVGLDSLTARFTWRVDRLIRYLASFTAVIRAARAAIRREAPAIVHANSIRAGLVMSVATVGLKVPVVWHAHDILPQHPLSAAVRLVAWASARNHVIAVSRAVADRFCSALLHMFRRRVAVTTIHNAVDLERFKPNSESRREIRRILGVAERELLIGAIGQLTRRKGQRELIDAFAKVAHEIPQAILVIVGEPLFNRDRDYAESLRRAAGSLGVTDRVRFLGPRDDVPALMQGLDLLVVNSRAEPFALTVLEGLASGTPVLATAVGGTPEMIRHSENGWLVVARDPKPLATAMLKLLREATLRESLGQNGRSEAVLRFSTDRYLREIEALYREVLAGGKTPHYERASNLKTELSAD